MSKEKDNGQVFAPDQGLSDVPEVIKEHWKVIKKVGPDAVITWEELMLD